MMATYDRDDVLAALTLDAVLAWTGTEVCRPAVGDWHGRTCPSGIYHSHSSRAFVVSPEPPHKWVCNCCGTRGDILTAIAAHAGITTRGADYPRALAIAAEIAGVPARQLTDEERAARRAAARERQAQQHREALQREQFERAWGIEHATAYWEALPTSNTAGERYLRERGLHGAIARGLVRFDPMGEWLSAGVRDSIATPLLTADGQIVNIRRRRLPRYVHGPDGQRFSPLPSCISGYGLGTYVGAINDVAASRDTVLVEGFADSLTAALAWPDALVIGAQSASNLPGLGEHIATRVRRHGGRMLVVPHDDDSGIRHAEAACLVAIHEGLRLDETLVIVNLRAPDLNDAWRAGWRP